MRSLEWIIAAEEKAAEKEKDRQIIKDALTELAETFSNQALATAALKALERIQ